MRLGKRIKRWLYPNEEEEQVPENNDQLGSGVIPIEEGRRSKRDRDAGLSRLDKVFPSGYNEDVKKIAETMRSNQTTTMIVHLGSIQSVEEQKRVVDFLMGVAFALDGHMAPVSKVEPIWLYTSKNVQVTNVGVQDIG